MLVSPYQRLLQLAFAQPAEVTCYLHPTTLAAYRTFEQAEPADIAYRFERVRLGVALTLMKLLAELGDLDEARQVLDVLHQALRAPSVFAIDTTIQKDAAKFERLYTNLYVNEDGEQLLHLFERTLDADSQPLMDDVIREALRVVPTLDFSREEDEDDEEGE
ncbi:hypothetical protein [Hymenobacter rubripertinctus]|uniref:Uncharacterized protein n=1 Tax=Hymenobacter rubripertinctus TaxID=2029981 RepID=A0A418R434_9BACT|nr:hypothetical protein [Hymenobacter rubripertinctus]RIY12207.1 hypothetical protein D0T11_06105 [Hymenobacter rubripertinctus]